MKLNERLAQDTVYLTDFRVSQLRLLKDGEVPWFVLVPKRENCNEWTDLDLCDQQELLKEINLLSKFLKTEFKVDKVNIASIGNLVPQLHIHVIGRFKWDRSWPGTIWGTKSPVEYHPNKRQELLESLKNYL